MGDMTRNLSEWEYQCHGGTCCDYTAPDMMRLARPTQALRDIVACVQNKRGLTNDANHRLTISRGFSCQRHNATVGSKRDSQHPRGTGEDVLTPVGMSVVEFAELAELVPEFREGGIIMYDWGLHLDIREDGPYREDKQGETP